MFQPLVQNGFDISCRAHANAILAVDFPQAEDEITSVLQEFRIDVPELVAGGGGEASITQRLRRALSSIGWMKENFSVMKTINGVVTESTTHEIDHVKIFENGTIALEIEWNNKDPFYDRDLENFHRLHADNAISMGIIITRGASLQAAMDDVVLQYGRDNDLSSFEALVEHELELTSRQKKNITNLMRTSGRTFVESWAKNQVKDKFGQATTHWNKLEDRISRGVGNPCPFVGIGLPVDILVR